MELKAMLESFYKKLKDRRPSDKGVGGSFSNEPLVVFEISE